MGDWISVEDRLPEEGVPVLAIDMEGGEPGILFAVRDGMEWLEQDSTLWIRGKWKADGVWLVGPTHWQPLPEPPEVQG
jgi:hypothetical protein